MMNSFFTMEERVLLQSLDCGGKREAITLLEDMLHDADKDSHIYDIADSLLGKLKNSSIDFAYEMRLDRSLANDSEEM